MNSLFSPGPSLVIEDLRGALCIVLAFSKLRANGGTTKSTQGDCPGASRVLAWGLSGAELKHHYDSTSTPSL